MIKILKECLENPEKRNLIQLDDLKISWSQYSSVEFDEVNKIIKLLKDNELRFINLNAIKDIIIKGNSVSILDFYK